MSESTPKPTVGRIVHYRGLNSKSQPYPAIITHVHSDECVNLYVFDDGTFPLQDGCGIATSVTRGGGNYEWNWMPYQLKKSHGSESGEKSAGTEAI